MLTDVFLFSPWIRTKKSIEPTRTFGNAPNKVRYLRGGEIEVLDPATHALTAEPEIGVVDRTDEDR